jgi:hypothetical protein
MIVTNNNQKLHDFKAWSGAVDTKQTILDQHKSEDFEFLIDELYPDGLTETQLNDLLWFEEEWIYKQLNIKNQ